MAGIETLGILDEIQALVSDRLQVVSYKWLSRHFFMSSNAAKRLLQEFVEKHGSELEVLYALSGWLKNNPSSYHIRLVSQPKLAEAKQDFDGHCSIQVYSVQACIPRDPATLWNAEFSQAEELFQQPPTSDNCLFDNRFCGVLNSFVKRSTEGALNPAASLTKSVVSGGVSGPFKSNSSCQTAIFRQPQQSKFQQLSPVIEKSESESQGTEGHEQVKKSAADKEVPQLSANKNKRENEKSSLTSMWDRASVKSKSNSASVENNDSIPNSTASAEAQICAREAEEDIASDDDGDINFKRASNGEGGRKRRVLLYCSDEEDDYKDAVNLASPDPPKKQSSPNAKASFKTSLEKNRLNFDKQKEDKLKNEEKKIDKKCGEEFSDINNGKRSLISSSSDNIHISVPQNAADMKNKVMKADASSPKKRKVLKTMIDERGREVTEVVWENKEKETKPEPDNGENANNGVVNDAAYRPLAAKRSPAVGSPAPANPVGRAGNKKAGNKDPKQGNLLSFFKKV